MLVPKFKRILKLIKDELEGLNTMKILGLEVLESGSENYLACIGHCVYLEFFNFRIENGEKNEETIVFGNSEINYTTNLYLRSKIRI